MPDSHAATIVPPEIVSAPRAVEGLVRGVATQDGAGVKLTRVISQPLQRRLDPFLMLDAFASDDPEDYIAGFPDHPHRGFETVTYMIAGRLRHRDHLGNEGLLQNGDVQWMTAARGIVHSEMPEQEDGVMEGFQLWLNLPARDKMADPWYRDIASVEIPEFETANGVRTRVVAGESHDIAGAVARDGTQPLFLDIHLPAGADFAQAIPDTHNAFLYVYRGTVRAAEDAQEIATRHMAVFANTPGSDGVRLRAGHAEPARALLIAGRPLGEPIVQYGPFVMNTEQEIHQAIDDFRRGRLS